MKFSTMEELFTYIFRTNGWRGAESLSGVGSDSAQTGRIVAALPGILREFGLRTLLDVPCGDFNWMASVDLSGIRYIGGDIVTDLVVRNRRHERDNVTFMNLDIIKDSLPDADIILCRDCLVHFSIPDIFRALENVCRGESRYLLTTTFTARTQNPEIPTGMWRPLNLQAAPFNFPQPLIIMEEGCTQGNGSYRDKSLALWPLSDIRRCLASV
jgi:hypothetical protein